MGFGTEGRALSSEGVSQEIGKHHGGGNRGPGIGDRVGLGEEPNEAKLEPFTHTYLTIVRYQHNFYSANQHTNTYHFQTSHATW